MNKTLYLFRHAKATGSDVGYGDKILTAEVTPEGIPPIGRMAEYLKTTGVSGNYCSELIRCRQTAKVITDTTGKEFVFDKRLIEYYDETFEEFVSRVKSFLKFLSGTVAANILVCTHGMVIAAMKHLILEGQFTLESELDYPKTGELWILQKSRVEAINFNKT